MGSERETRLELATFSLATRHSTTELLPQVIEACGEQLTKAIMHEAAGVCQYVLRILPKNSRFAKIMPSIGFEPTLYAA